MSKNIVLLSGSPRKGGNTDLLSAAFVEGAESAGKSVTTFRVADMKIAGCLGCRQCVEAKGVCVQKDDMPPILDALQKADAFVMDSPVYFFGVTAQLKLAIDRTYALLRVERPIKRAAILLTCGNPSAEVANGAIEMYHRMCGYSKWEEAGIIVATGLHQPGAINGRDELEKARELGRTI